MTPYILDTDTLSLFQQGHPKVLQHCRVHPPADLATTVITVEEQIRRCFQRGTGTSKSRSQSPFGNSESTVGTPRSGKPGARTTWPWRTNGWLGWFVLAGSEFSRDDSAAMRREPSR